MNQRVYRFLPMLEMEEALMIDSVTRDFSDNDMQFFAGIYGSRRKDSQMILLLALVGFLGFAGIHRFIMGQVGMGILYLLTAGLCFIGTIVDLINHRQMALEYNTQVANEVHMLIRSSR
jgi:TM2 domain-containing membrane protein YozV